MKTNELSAAAMLAVEGRRGLSTDPRDNARPTIKLITHGANELNQRSRWFRPDLQPGDFLLGDIVIHGDEGFEFQPCHIGHVWIEREKTPTGERQKAIWGREPADAEWVTGKGGGFLRSNGNSLLERVDIGGFVTSPPSDEPWLLSLIGSDNRRIVSAFNKRAATLRFVDAGGHHKKLSLFGAYWRITSVSHADADRRWVEPRFEPVAVFGEAGGPDEAAILRGADLCSELEAISYPDPDMSASSSVIPIASRRRVNGPPEPPPPSAPPAGSEDYDGLHPGVDPSNDIPF